jgi:hypothetical protein
MHRVSFRISSIFFAAVLVTGCVDLSAVNDFAKESTVLSSDKGMLDDTAAQTQARSYDSTLLDPKSKEFTDRLAITNQALVALNGYMTVLAQLSANGTPSVSAQISTIDTALKSLNVSDSKLQPSMNAVGALANVLLATAVRSDIRKLVKAAAQPVDQITAYLVDQAQTTSNTYNQAIAGNNRYWGQLTAQTAQDKHFCSTSSICNAVYALVAEARDSEAASLSAKAASADAAAAAFNKIRRDNAALVTDVAHLNSKDLVATLKSDEPELVTAIRNVRSL